MEEAKKLFELILQVANRLLRNAKMFELHILQNENPSYEQVAKNMAAVAEIIQELSDDEDPMLAQKAIEYVHILGNMGIAIRNQDEVRLSELVKELDAKPFL